MNNPIFIENCIRCGNPLLAKEIKAKECWCAPCKKIHEAEAHRKALAESINQANRKVNY